MTRAATYTGSAAKSRAPPQQPAVHASETKRGGHRCPPQRSTHQLRRQNALRIWSTTFLASPNSIMVLSRKNTSFSTPA